MTINKGKMDKNSKEDKEWSIKILKTTLKKLSSMQSLYVVLFIIAGWSTSEGADDTSYAYRYLDNYYPEEIDKIMANLYKERI